MSGISLYDWEKEFIRKNKKLINDGNWDEFFINLEDIALNVSDISDIYQFIMFEAGIDLLHNMSFIPEGAFYQCSYHLGNLVVPSNITLMNYSAFEYCGTLASIDLSKTKIEDISSRCFHHCDNLKKVLLPETCYLINVSAFHYCKRLETINLENIVNIENFAFYECENLKSVDLSGMQQYCGTGSFYDCHFNDITLSSKAKKEFVDFIKWQFPNADIKVV